MNIAYFAIYRCKRFPRINFRVAVCFADQYYVFNALPGLGFWSQSQYSYQFLFEIGWLIFHNLPSVMSGFFFTVLREKAGNGLIFPTGLKILQVTMAKL